MFTAGRGVFSTALSSSSAFKGGMTGLGTLFKRNYGSYDVLMLPPCIKPDTVEAAEAAAHSMLTSAYEQGFFAKKLDAHGTPALRMITSTEFALNGYFDGKVYKYDASNPISTTIYNTLVEKISEYAPQVDPSVIFCPGTAVVDIGKDDAGKTIIENRSILMQGTNGLSPEEAKNNVVTFSKALKSNIDLPAGSEQAFTWSSGTGPTLISVKDFTGDRDAVIALAICLDLEQLKDLPFPIDPQLVLNPSAGSPIDKPTGPAEVVVPDVLRLPFDTEGMLTSKVYEPVKGLEKAYPGIAKALSGIETVVGRGKIADAAQYLMASLVLSPNEQFNSVERFKPVGVEIVENSSGEKMVKTELRELPTLDDATLTKYKSKMENSDGQITILYPEGGTVETSPETPPPPDPSQGGEGFDPNEKEFQLAVKERVNKMKDALCAM